jgi:hypothetical protein
MRVSKSRFRKHSFGFSSLAVMIPTLLAASLHDAYGATPISAKAGLDKKLQKLVIAGKTTGIAAKSLINVYDLEDHRLVFAGQTDAKSTFRFVTSQDTLPCALELQSGDFKTVIAVGGADKTCKSKPACSIVGGDRSTVVDSNQSFQASYKANKKLPMQIDWDFGDTKSSSGDSSSHSYSAQGLYRVTMTGSIADKTGNQQQCSDAITVSVAPPSGSNPNATVEEAAPRPATASAMPTANGGNDDQALVVFPYEEMGMEGGSQINIPYNALYPYNAMNAQIIRKDKHKPKILGSQEVEVRYSAAINPKDPVKAAGAEDSINSTSQNLFANAKAGANFDPETSSTAKTVYNDDHSYGNALIAKTELWDKVHQPNATKIDPVNGVEKGLSQADVQNTITAATPLPMVKPDEGIRGNSDLKNYFPAGIRTMPGIEKPYQENVAQKFDYNAEQ